MPFGPALPNGVRTPSTKTTSRRERDMKPPQEWEPPRGGAAPPSSPPVTPPPSGTCPQRVGNPGHGLRRGRRRRQELERELDLPLARASGTQHLADGRGVGGLRRAPHDPA